MIRWSWGNFLFQFIGQNSYGLFLFMFFSNFIVEIITKIPPGRLTQWKMKCIKDLVDSKIFRLALCRGILLPVFCTQIKDKLESKEEVSWSFRLLPRFQLIVHKYASSMIESCFTSLARSCFCVAWLPFWSEWLLCSYQLLRHPVTFYNRLCIWLEFNVLWLSLHHSSHTHLPSDFVFGSVVRDQ